MFTEWRGEDVLTHIGHTSRPERIFQADAKKLQFHRRARILGIGRLEQATLVSAYNCRRNGSISEPKNSLPKFDLELKEQ